MEHVSILLNYGVLGLWTGSLLIEKFNTQKRFKEALDNLTNAINRRLI